MRKLLEFLIGKRHWFLFILLEAVSLMLVYRNNAYQRNIIFSSANVVTGYIASISGSVTSYLNLRDINKELLERNGQLELQMLDLQDQLDALICAGFDGAISLFVCRGGCSEQQCHAFV
mgnify:CR=1 FL=1